MQEIEATTRVNEIMQLYPELTDVLMDLGLCGCNYGRESHLMWTVERVAQDKGIAVDELLKELNNRIKR
ncbi:hypothetical protein BMS3Abin07_01300 [bacterium BMS3Abin07]|nr:hypothetical protein BMS3Abin07_01300 [bacterium BMS3Abin07]GBE33144.1 hypothetical protein BMS3Bbin05_02082 [bacterium BMS3Bbin05]